MMGPLEEGRPILDRLFVRSVLLAGAVAAAKKLGEWAVEELRARSRKDGAK